MGEFIESIIQVTRYKSLGYEYTTQTSSGFRKYYLNIRVKWLFKEINGDYSYEKLEPILEFNDHWELLEKICAEQFPTRWYKPKSYRINKSKSRIEFKSSDQITLVRLLIDNA